MLKTGYRLFRPIFDPLHAFRNLCAYPRFLKNIRTYKKLAGAEPSSMWAVRPILEDWTTTTGFDAHYVYLGAWAFRKIVEASPPEHIDVGSQISWVTCLASVTKVTFIDIRPFVGNIPNLTSTAGSVLAMPYADKQINSLSCLHVVEHIGLGRYGDPLNPYGSKDAIRELSRVLAPGGRLYFALPVGKPRIMFNAHRIHDPTAVVEQFAHHGLRLRDFALVNDQNVYSASAKPEDVADADYACGLYTFER